MSSNLISGFASNGIVTVNRVILKPQYSVDDLEERVAELCENVKTYHSETGFVGGCVFHAHPATDSTPIRPLIPRPSGH